MDPTDAVFDETQKKLNHLKWYHQLHLSAIYLLLKMEKRRTWRHQQAEPLPLLSAGEPRDRERLAESNDDGFASIILESWWSSALMAPRGRAVNRATLNIFKYFVLTGKLLQH
jgi:hypothetical protein